MYLSTLKLVIICGLIGLVSYWLGYKDGNANTDKTDDDEDEEDE